MDHPRTAAQKIRPILQAMERSIDSARRRRTNEPEPVPGTGVNMNAASSVMTNQGASASVNHRSMNSMPGSVHSQRQTALDQTRIGGGSGSGGATVPANNPAGVIRPGDVNHQGTQSPNQTGLQPNQPPRLKAKPKPASPFLNALDPPAYRQQAS